MNWNVVLPLLSSVLSLVFALMLLDQWLERRRAYQLIWAAGMLWYGLAAGTEALGGAFGWTETLYRLWYLIGAIWVAAWLGLGTVYLLAKTRFGYAFAAALLFAGLFTYLTQQRYQYPDAGSAPVIYFGVALVLAIVTAVLTWRGSDRWPQVAALVVVGGSLVSIVLMAMTTLPPPGYAVDPVTGIPEGTIIPGYLRLLTPFFNITGGFALAFGAFYSAYMFMPKRRVIRYHLERNQPPASLARNLVVAPVAIVLNFAVSLPGAVVALFRGQLNSRVPATLLIFIGGLVPSITSGLSRFGDTSAFFVGELLGVLFLFSGFLVSIEVFHEIRVPFTHRVLHLRRAEV
jgi:hypothetical protein